MKREIRLIAALWVILCVGLTGTSRGQNSVVTRATMLGLPGVAIVVDSLSTEMLEKGMIPEVFRIKIVLKLMEAGIPILDPEAEQPVPGNPVLLLGITTVFDDAAGQCMYGICLELTQTVHLARNPFLVADNVPTWSVEGIGISGARWRDALIDDVLGFTEEFVDAFTEANPIIEQE